MDSIQYRLVEEVFRDTLDHFVIQGLLGDYSVLVNSDSAFRANQLCHLSTWATISRGADSANMFACQAIFYQMQSVIGVIYNERNNAECAVSERLLLTAAGEFVDYTGVPFNPKRKSGTDKAISNLLDGRVGYVTKRLRTDGGFEEWTLVIVFCTLFVLGGLTMIKLITKLLKRPFL